MDEKEWKACIKKHGYIFSDGEEDSDSESKLVFDKLYEAFKPPPILIDPKKHKIIQIGSSDSDSNSTCTHSATKSETKYKKQHQKLTKSQKKRRRKQLLKENRNNVVPISGTVVKNNNEHIDNQSEEKNEDNEVFKQDSNSPCTHSSTKRKKKNKEQHQQPTNSQKKRRCKQLGKRNQDNVVPMNDESETVVKNKNEHIDNKSGEKNEDNEVFKQDTPKTEYIASDVASTSSSEYVEKLEVTNDTKSINESKKLNGNPLSYMSTHHIQYNFLGTLDFMLLQLNVLIETNPADSLTILSRVQLCLKTIENFGIKRKSITCLAVLLVETAARFQTFITDLRASDQLSVRLKVDRFLCDLNTTILAVVMKHHGLNLPEVMNELENLVFRSFELVLRNLSEKIIKILYQITGVHFVNPFRHIVVYPGTVWESFYKMLHLVDLAKSIQQAQINAAQVVKNTLSEGNKGYKKPPLVIVQEQKNADFSSDRASDKGKVRLPVVEDSRNQSQLQPLVVDDLTRTRRFFHDGSYSGPNFQSWQKFQNLYFNETLHAQHSIVSSYDKTTKTDFLTEIGASRSQSQLQPLVVDDLTRNRRFLYDASFSGPNFASWRNFQNSYLNEKWSVLDTSVEKLSQVQLPSENSKFVGSEDDSSAEGFECQFRPDEKSQFDNKPFGVCVVTELSPVEFPLSWILTSCDVRILISSIMFVLFFRKILYCIFLVFSFTDVFILVLLLLYLCAYFVIKF